MTKSFTKKIALTILFIITFSLPINIVFAEKVEVDDLIYQSGIIDDDPYVDQVKTFGTLPDINLDQGVGITIKTVLSWSFYLTLISLIVTAIYYIIAMGQEEDITKAKHIILYLVIGMAIIAGAYGITSGVSRFNFFNEEVAEDVLAK